jgi:hypothetical protein
MQNMQIDADFSKTVDQFVDDPEKMTFEDYCNLLSPEERKDSKLNLIRKFSAYKKQLIFDKHEGSIKNIQDKISKIQKEESEIKKQTAEIRKQTEEIKKNATEEISKADISKANAEAKIATAQANFADRFLQVQLEKENVQVLNSKLQAVQVGVNLASNEWLQSMFSKGIGFFTVTKTPSASNPQITVTSSNPSLLPKNN